MKVLIICTANSCRSQMATALLAGKFPDWEVFSAGTYPARFVHPLAIEVMQEIGLDISENVPQSIDKFLKEDFDYVLTVCGDAQDSCPEFFGNTKNKIHIGFDDPASFIGDKAEMLDEFRRVRDEINEALIAYFQNK